MLSCIIQILARISVTDIYLDILLRSYRGLRLRNAGSGAVAVAVVEVTAPYSRGQRAAREQITRIVGIGCGLAVYIRIACDIALAVGLRALRVFAVVQAGNKTVGVIGVIIL